MNKIDNVIDIAKDFIAIESTTRNSKEIAKAVSFIEEYLKKFQPSINFTTFKNGESPSIIAYNSKKLPQDGFKVLLNGHLDVVPAKKDQYKLRVEGDKLIGRGTLDMKLSLIAMLDSFTRIAPTLSSPVGLQISSDEEVGGKLGTGFQQSKGIKTEFFMGGETTGLKIANQAKGVCWARLTATASSQHAAYQWEGRSLVDEAATVVQNIRKIYPLLDSQAWKTTVTLANIKTDNTALNKSPSEVCIELDIRYTPDDPNFVDKNVVKAFFQKIQGAFQLDILELEPAHGVYTSRGSQYLDRLQAAIEKNTGKSTELIKKSGASDARFYARESTAVLFGVEGDGLHADYEYVSKASLSTFLNTVDDFLSSID